MAPERQGRPLAYTAKEAAELLRVSDATIRSMVKAGKLPQVPGLGSSIRIPSRALYELVGEPPPPVLEPATAPRHPDKRSDPPDPPIARARPVRHYPPVDGYAPIVQEPTVRRNPWVPRYTRPAKQEAPIQIGDQHLWLLADDGKRSVMTWHIGSDSALCARKPEGRWAKSASRSPMANICPTCLTIASQAPGIDFASLPITYVCMVRQMKRGDTVTLRKSGWHTGDGRRTNCGKKEGPWHLTERRLSYDKQCFECREWERWRAEQRPDSEEHRARGRARWCVLLDSDIDPSGVVELAGRAPGHVVVRQANRPITVGDIAEDWGKALTDLYREGARLSDGIAESWLEQPPSPVVSNNPDLASYKYPPQTLPSFTAWLTPIIDDTVRARALRAKWERESKLHGAARRASVGR